VAAAAFLGRGLVAATGRPIRAAGSLVEFILPLLLTLFGLLSLNLGLRRRRFGYTYPSKLPFLPIDRIFTGHGLRAVDFHMGDTRASDHSV
jgi:hypothetical protein